MAAAQESAEVKAAKEKEAAEAAAAAEAKAAEEAAAAEAAAKAKADEEAKAAKPEPRARGAAAAPKGYRVTGAAVVLRTKDKTERYLYRGAAIPDGVYADDSIKHAISVGLIEKAK